MIINNDIDLTLVKDELIKKILKYKIGYKIEKDIFNHINKLYNINEYEFISKYGFIFCDYFDHLSNCTYCYHRLDRCCIGFCEKMIISYYRNNGIPIFSTIFNTNIVYKMGIII